MQLLPTHELQYLGFLRFAPPDVLAPYIQCFWVINSAQPLAHSRQETLYPDGGSSIIFNFGSPYELDGNLHTERVLYQGSCSQRVLMGLDTVVDAIGVRFTPGGAYRFLGIPMSDLHHRELPLTDLGISGLDTLHEQLTAMPKLASRLKHLTQWLYALLNSAPKVQPISELVSQLLTHTYSLSTDQLANNNGYSRRKLERLFKVQVGLAPNTLKQLQKVGMARTLLKTQPQPSLTDVAMHCGYYDQAHFIRHFKAVTGQTPGAYRQRKQLPQTYNS